MKMRYDNLIRDLLTEFPVLESFYIEEGNYIEGLPHLCFEIVFVPFVKQVCTFDDGIEISKICSFMEQMSISEDEMVQEVLAVSVLESILSEREVVGILKRHLKTHTLELLDLLEKEYGWA
jgi:hypothetical protein